MGSSSRHSSNVRIQRRQSEIDKDNASGSVSRKRGKIAGKEIAKAIADEIPSPFSNGKNLCFKVNADRNGPQGPYNQGMISTSMDSKLYESNHNHGSNTLNVGAMVLMTPNSHQPNIGDLPHPPSM